MRFVLGVSIPIAACAPRSSPPGEVAELEAELARWRASCEAEQQAHGETTALLAQERKTNAVRARRLRKGDRDEL